MSKCIEKIKHSCGHHSLQIFQQEDGSYDGFCFYCGKREPNPILIVWAAFVAPIALCLSYISDKE